MSIQADPRHIASQYLERAGDLAYKSAAAIPADKVSFKPEPGVKSAHEILKHMVEVNEVFIKGLKNPGAELDDADNARISDSTADYPKSLDALKDSNARLVDVVAKLPEEAISKNGELDLSDNSLYKRMEIGSLHLVYHWGQIASLQTYWDDQEDHFLK